MRSFSLVPPVATENIPLSNNLMKPCCTLSVPCVDATKSPDVFVIETSLVSVPSSNLIDGVVVASLSPLIVSNPSGFVIPIPSLLLTPSKVAI